MKLIKICPECGALAVGVKGKAVKNNIINPGKDQVDTSIKWSICTNPKCSYSYFSKGKVFKNTDLKSPLFFKDDSDNVPICYCSNLTRGEIKKAVSNGSKSIKDVQKYTKKNMTGHCNERNPLGKCCRNVFLKTISDSTS